MLFRRLESARETLKIAATNDCLCVSISEQKLAHFRAGKLFEVYAVSTSRAEPSCVPDSLGTPLGLHRILEKIGAGEPAGMVFKARKPLGFLWQNAPAELCNDNLITSRIMWLDGLEPGKNHGTGRDTHSRYVYIHGTNQEDKIGTPNSHGCVLLKNSDVTKLFESVPAESLVWIEDDRK